MVITPEKIDELCSTVNQVIHSSSPISWPNFKPLTQIVFKKSCFADKLEMSKLAKGHNSRQIWRNLFKSKLGNLLIIQSADKVSSP